MGWAGVNFTPCCAMLVCSWRLPIHDMLPNMSIHKATFSNDLKRSGYRFSDGTSIKSPMIPKITVPAEEPEILMGQLSVGGHIKRHVPSRQHHIHP